MSKAPAWFGPALLRAQRIDAYNAQLRKNPDFAAECPIGESVMRDYAYANPPFEHVNDYASFEDKP